MKAGIYIHIPFCDGKCRYCDFYSLRAAPGQICAYVAAAKNQMSTFPRLQADTVYFGGGTPSLLSANELYELLEAARTSFDISPDVEITAEINPADCDIDKLRELRKVGINRLSVGVQSLDDGALRLLGRRHDSARALLALEDAARAGFENVSADLMLAIPGMDLSAAKKAASRFCDLPVTHISAYLLKICEGTPFGDNPPAGLPDDDGAAAQYEAVAGIFAQNGFERYEISNYTKGNNRSKHNIKYWDCADYAGIGPAAHSSIGQKRYSRKSDLAAYLADFKQARGGSFSDFLDFEGAVDGEDFIICRLRTADGLPLGELRERFGVDLEKLKGDELALLADGGFLRVKNGVVTLSDKGLLVSNSVLTRLI